MTAADRNSTTAVMVMETNFFAGATVMFGDMAAMNVAVASGTSILAITPVNTAGAVTDLPAALMGTSFPLHVSGQDYHATGPGTSFTSSSFNSAGANLLVIFLPWRNHIASTTTDSCGNAWLPLPEPAYKIGSDYFQRVGKFLSVTNAKTGIGRTVTVTLSQSEPLLCLG